MALEQAKATYNIRVDDPIFLIWTEDPSSSIEDERASGLIYYGCGVALHLGLQAALVLGFVFALWLLGW